MKEVFSKVIDSISGTVPQSDKEYIGEDGLLHCLICKRNVQTEVEFLGKKKIVRCICDCRKKEIDAFNEREKQDNIARQRNVCFSESEMKKWNFNNDDRRNAELSDAMLKYVKNFEDFKKEGTGLLLYGDVGTGKTFYAACIANSLIDKGHSVLMTNFAKLTNTLQGMFEGKQNYIDNLNKYKLLIIDDLGIERKTEYMQEQVFNIIDSRYRTGLPFIITTNLNLVDISNTTDIAYSRIYDRILERCFPVKISGTSRRKDEFSKNYKSVKEKLGL
jgi:DNA replication protein DnaC